MASVGLGVTGIVLNMTGLLLSFPRLNFVAVLIGRFAGIAYITAIDRFRPLALVPMGVAVINSFMGMQELIFLEMLLQSIIYQYMAILTFMKLNQK